MVKALGIIFGAILVSIPIVYLNYKWGDDFLYKFFKEQSIAIVATVVALNIATITFLLGHLAAIENKANAPLFGKTRSEIRDNAYFMMAMFAIIFLLANSMNKSQQWQINSFAFNPLVAVAVVAFILVFVCLFEILAAIFSATEFINKNS